MSPPVNGENRVTPARLSDTLATMSEASNSWSNEQVPRPAAELLPLVYDELRKLAAARIAQERPGHTLAPTALVHEAYLRLAATPGPEQPRFANRRHFFAAAAEAMRRILIDRARQKQRIKHGGGQQRQELDELALALPEPNDDLLALDEALERLAQAEPELAEVVKLHYFVGLPLLEVAEVLGVAPRTAYRHWAYAKAWLRREVGAGYQG